MYSGKQKGVQRMREHLYIKQLQKVQRRGLVVSITIIQSLCLRHLREAVGPLIVCEQYVRNMADNTHVRISILHLISIGG
jgi:hypothetical protein